MIKPKPPILKLPSKPLTEAERVRMITWLKHNLYKEKQNEHKIT